MPWLQLEMKLGALAAGQAEQALAAAGAVSVTLTDAGDEALFEPRRDDPPLWSRLWLTALFPATADPDALRALLLAALGLPQLPEHRFRILEDREWTREWLKDFKPMRFGKRLWIVPSAHAPPEPAAVNVRLDPGLAFGTGTHPTTRLCLEWLDRAELAGREVIDYGCGSGILAVAAAKLGARTVRAVDTDPQALTATRRNARGNRVAGRIRTFAPETLPPAPADVLIANILAGPLVALAPRFARLLKPGGQLVLSGILAEQQALLAAAYAPDFLLTGVAQRAGWLRLEGLRRS